MSNFSFLKEEWQELWEIAQEAEQYCLSVPRHAANLCRISLETAIHWMYDNDAQLDIPYDKTLFNLMKQPSFENLVPYQIRNDIHAIRQAGNIADHTQQKIAPREALLCVENLHRFLQFFAREYSEEDFTPQSFNEFLVPTSIEDKKTTQELKKVKEELEARIKEIERLKILNSENEAKIQQVREQEVKIRKLKERNSKRTPIPEKPNETETRLFYIDLLLKEAGWDLEAPDVLEYKVTGMPTETNPSGIGHADYVLWGEDGLPLAVLEAKRTLKSVEVGKRQAELYADCLEKMKGQRPIIFYSNGYETFIWDDQNYPPRQVFGMYTRDELQTLINRRKDKKDLTKIIPNKNIAGRFYQIEAIKRVVEAFQVACQRHALIVMATGTGKTRLATSLVEILSRGNWIKRVLFLADRNALVRQGKKKFSEFLLDIPMVDVTKDKENKNSRIVFSTYPTMLNMIDGRDENGEKYYSVGHFDLIIVDEAHRSVYNKYKAIFDYFDALMIGLTATPKDEIDHNTYELFKVPDGNPTFAYELGQAVKDDFLKPPKALSVPLKFPRKGIKYKELTKEEQEKYEATFRDEEGYIPNEIDKKALYQWLFNFNTIDQVLTYLMENGQKVEGGDKLGKTIIFANNHEHAVWIEKRFEFLYPQLKGKYLRIIDYQDPKAESTLADFSNKKKMPQIAVSVDMLDTGIDIPEIVNLVFFKRVYSTTKFWQMIGRGTRPCEDLFEPGKDKEFFYVLDFCENFEFFDENPDGISPVAGESISQQNFKLKLRIAEKLKEQAYVDSEPLQQLRQQYLDELHHQVIFLNRDNFSVRKQLSYVDQYSNREVWDDLSQTAVATIERELSHLPVVIDNNEMAKRFDVLIHRLQLAHLEKSKIKESLSNQVISIAQGLSKKMNIPAIAQKKKKIHKLLTNEYWKDLQVDNLEEVREDLRSLIEALKKEKQAIVYSDIKDEIVGKAVEHDILSLGTRLQSYKLRVERYLRENSHMLAIQRVRKGEILTQAELESLENLMFDEGPLGTKEEFQREYGTDKPLTYFIRSILGFDKGAAKEAFGEFLNDKNLTADQITFINNIIDCLERNGVIDKGMLFEPPFTYLHDDSAFGIFPKEDATKIFSIVDSLNEGLA